MPPYKLQQQHVRTYSQQSVGQSDKLSMPMLTSGQHQKLLRMLDTSTINEKNGVVNMAGDPKHLHHEGLIENAGQIQLPTGDLAQVSHIGNCHLEGGDVLREVLCAPTFKFNLMSVSQVAKDLNYSVTFFPQNVVFFRISHLEK